MDPEGFGVRVGQVIAGRYRVDGVLGQGGFGAVFRATQLNLGRIVALKMLHSHLVSSQESMARFEREAQLAQTLCHPNTVRLYDFGHTEDGAPWIAWEHLEGQPLDEVIRAEGSLSPARVARIARQVLASLSEAHSLGIVHRDIKPSNLFLCRFAGEADFIKVLDFGIAKSATPGGAAPMTQAGMAVGTPSYMAPEQVMAGEVGPSTDLYALGLVMAEALTGRTVYTGETPMAVFVQHASDAPVPLAPEVHHSALGQIVVCAVEKSPLRRYGYASHMRDAIEAVLPGLPEVAAGAVASPGPVFMGTSQQMAMADPTLHPAEAPPAKRSPLLYFGIGLGVLAMMLGTAALGAALSDRSTSSASDRSERRDDDRDKRAKKVGWGRELPGVDLDEDDEEPEERPAKTTCHRDREFHGTSPKTLEKRIVKAGYELSERNVGPVGAGVITWTLGKGDAPTGMIQYYRYNDSLSPGLTFDICEDADEVWALDGRSLLAVDLYEEDQRSAEKLLLAITKPD